MFCIYFIESLGSKTELKDFNCITLEKPEDFYKIAYLNDTKEAILNLLLDENLLYYTICPYSQDMAGMDYLMASSNLDDLHMEYESACAEI